MDEIEIVKRTIKKRLESYDIRHSTLEFECEECRECSIVSPEGLDR